MVDTTRPVMTRDQTLALGKRILSMLSADSALIRITHTARAMTRLANGQVLFADDGDELKLTLDTAFGGRGDVILWTNQLDDTALRAAVQRCEAVAHERVGGSEQFYPSLDVQDTYLAVHLWHDTTIRAMTSTLEAILPEFIGRVARENLQAAGYVGFMARSHAFLSTQGIVAHCEETDAEVVMTARTRDGKASGWAGQAARDWSTIDYQDVANRAADIAKRSVNAEAIEPGRHTVILSAAAVAQMCRYFALEFNAKDTKEGATAFSLFPQGTRLGQRVFDPRITISSDPADPDGGYAPFFGKGYATPKMTWVENGILTNLAYDQWLAMLSGKPYAANPSSFRMSGGTMTIADMIASCKQGIYVNRFTNVDLVDQRTGMMTGVTSDGCFLVKNGQVTRPIKNLRFLESPFFALNSVMALGIPIRAPFGYTPPGFGEIDSPTWPRPPVIVPPMMVRDFNFNAIADVV